MSDLDRLGAYVCLFLYAASVVASIDLVPEQGFRRSLGCFIVVSITLLPLGLHFLHNARRIEAAIEARRRRIQRFDKLLDYQLRAFGYEEDTSSSKQDEDEGKYEYEYIKVRDDDEDKYEYEYIKVRDKKDEEIDDEYIDRGKRSKRRK